MNRLTLILIALFAISCGESGPTVQVKVYTAADQNPSTPINVGLLDPAVADVINVMVVPPGGGQLFSQSVSTGAGTGTLEGLPFGEGYRVEVRGFSTQNGPEQLVFYGGSAPFGVGDAEVPAVSVQVGKSGCVGLNNPSPMRRSRPQENADMLEPRFGAAATVLKNGSVLVTGGAAKLDANGKPVQLSNTAEVYDPNDGVFTPFAAALPGPISHHTATLLPNGRVLVVGGLSGDAAAPLPSTSAFTLDPVTGIAEQVEIGSAAPFQPRYMHKALALPGGDVLITGGLSTGDVPIGSTYRYFFNTNTLAEQGTMTVPRSGHTLTTINRYDATRMVGELAVVIGGRDAEGKPVALIETFTVTPAQMGCPNGEMASQDRGCWVPSANLSTPRWGHSAAAILGGDEVLIAGGFTTADRTQPTNQLEMLRANLQGATVDSMGNAMQGTLAVGQLSVARGDMATAVTTNGSGEIIVLSGGVQTTTGQPTVERIERIAPAGPSLAPTFQVVPLEQTCQQDGLPERRWGAQSVTLDNKVVLTVGGALAPAFDTTRRVELFFPPFVRPTQ